MNKAQYKILKASTTQGLEKDVNDHLQAGWMFFAGGFHIDVGCHDRYIQAVRRSDDEVVP